MRKTAFYKTLIINMIRSHTPRAKLSRADIGMKNAG